MFCTFYNIMILQIVGSLFVVLVAYLIQYWYIVPKRTMKQYCDYFRSKGYRVCQIPYNLLRNHFYQITEKYAKLCGDPYLPFKQNYPNYDVVVTNFLTRPYIQLCHPDLIKQFYAVDKHYTYPKLQKALFPICKISGLGLAFSEGKQWKRKRTILNKVFNFDFVKSQGQNIKNISQKTIRQMQHSSTIETNPNNNEKTVSYNILELCVDLFAQVILSSFLGMESNEKIQGMSVGFYIKKLIDDATVEGYKLSSMMLGERISNYGVRQCDKDINRRNKLYRDWAMTYIEKRVATINQKIKVKGYSEKPSDIIEALMLDYSNSNSKQNKNENQRSDSSNQGTSITQIKQLYDQFTTFFFAATQTTSNFLQMIIYFIAKHPHVQRKLREQIDTYMKEDDYSYENLKNLSYIDNIQKQTTRIYGPSVFLFLRRASQDNYIGGVPIKKETLVAPLTFGNHFSQKYFKDPHQFRPERWDEQECKNLPPFVMGGFSAGARSCIGKHLALLQSKIALVKFMKRYKKIILPNQNFKLQCKFVASPQYFKTKLVINQ